MLIEKFRYLQGVIGAHKEHTVQGRTRLQKTIRLLQRIGLPTDYEYTIFFYGPYSEALFFDLGLLELLGAVREKSVSPSEGKPFYHITALDLDYAADVAKFLPQIQALESHDSVVLELAATYDCYREMGHPHREALSRLQRKKGDKCTEHNVLEALGLLKNLKLFSGEGILTL